MTADFNFYELPFIYTNTSFTCPIGEALLVNILFLQRLADSCSI